MSRFYIPSTLQPSWGIMRCCTLDDLVATNLQLVDLGCDSGCQGWSISLLGSDSEPQNLPNQRVDWFLVDFLRMKNHGMKNHDKPLDLVGIICFFHLRVGKMVHDSPAVPTPDKDFHKFHIPLFEGRNKPWLGGLSKMCVFFFGGKWFYLKHKWVVTQPPTDHVVTPPILGVDYGYMFHPKVPTADKKNTGWSTYPPPPRRNRRFYAQATLRDPLT